MEPSPGEELILRFRAQRIHLDGVVSLGGVSWFTRFPPVNEEVEVGFRVPGYDDEVTATAIMTRADENPDGEGVDIRALFTDIDVLSELALARWLSKGQWQIGRAVPS